MNCSSRLKLQIGLWAVLLFLTSGLAHAFQVGETVPDFTLPDLQGKKVSLSDHSDQVVVLELGTTWCPGCRFQSKEIGQLSEIFSAEEVAVYELFMQETAETVRSYLEGLDMDTSHALLDDGQVQRAYNVYLIPRVLVINKGGQVVFDRGMVEAVELEKIIRPLLDAGEKGSTQ